MYNTIKQIAFLFTLILILTITSCLNNPDDTIERTEAMEQAEIKSALQQIEAKGIDIDTTELGIYYIVDTLGKGFLPQAGDTCYLKYVGYFLDGTMFDASENNPENENGVWEFNFKEVSLIPGFEDGISLMSKGSKIDMIIPSEFAYGSTGYYTIPPYATLLFSAEMVDLRPKDGLQK